MTWKYWYFSKSNMRCIIYNVCNANNENHVIFVWDWNNCNTSFKNPGK